VVRTAGEPVLTRRTLNRTLLARQGLLARTRRSPESLIETLVGLQAQEPPDPYVALWSRIEAFDPAVLGGLLVDRGVVRIGLMRGTLHLVTARDCRVLYPIMRDVLVRAFNSSGFARQLEGVDIDALVGAGRSVVEERPISPAELGQRLAERWPDRDPTALAYAQRFLLPLVQVPPRGVWGQTGRTTNTTAEAWLGVPMESSDRADEVVRRYLRAFGPATVSDIRIWSWLTGLRAVIDRLRPELRVYRDDRGRALFDVADGQIADPDAPAPPRFLPTYDNIFLSHDDRTRIVGDRVAGHVLTWKGSVLVDGFIDGAWRIRRSRSTATMTLEHFGPHRSRERRAIEAEAERLLAFVAADAPTRVLDVVSDAG
jgi:DNA glycosylase AlkZ-like